MAIPSIPSLPSRVSGSASAPASPAGATSPTGRRWGARSGYIPGLDGLRALAVTAVIIFHVAPAVLPGGFVGVDVFFVLSGFLVTTLLLRDVARGRVNLPRFWLRRVRRLVPALLLLMIVVVPAAALASRDLLVGIRRQLIGALTFSTNWVEIAHGTSYFDSTTPVLLKNFWSLAIEEQFYLIWPLILIGLLALVPSARLRTGVAALLALTSAALMAVLYDPDHVTGVYYGTHTHVFGLGIGIVIAMAWAQPDKVLPRWLRAALSARASDAVGLLALIGLVASTRLLAETSPGTYRGGLLAASALAGVVIATMLRPGSLLARAGENVVLRWVGTRSYGLYLWHWPVLIISGVLVPTAIGSPQYWARSVVALLITAGVCEASFRFLETPVRRDGFRQVWRRALAACRSHLLALVAACLVVVLTVATIALALTAPAKSSTQLLIEQASRQDAVPASPAPPAASPASPAAPAAQPTATGAAASGLSPNLDASDPAPTDITAIGDSMLSASRTGLEYAMPGITVLAQPNRQWGQALEVVDAALAAGQVHRVVVLGLGTNAGLQDSAPVEAILDRLGPDRMVLLLNLYSPSTFVDHTNEVLAQVASVHPNVTVIDWHSVAAANPGLLQVDQTHTSIEGANTLGALVRDSAKDFAAQLRAKGAKGSGPSPTASPGAGQ